ncbi:MAG: ABC transporter permease [Acidobacteriia bacterium]|nr:ABC transporter permease [Terriglobia bacterium]
MNFAFWRRRQREEDLNQEIESHLAMAASEHAERGEALDAARHAVHREFGNVDLVCEVTRQHWGGRWLEHLVQDIRYGARMLRRNPVFALIAVLTLALGIGANTAVFSIVNAVFLRSLPFPDAGRIYQVGRTGNRIGGSSISLPIFLEWQDRQNVFEHLALIRWSGPETLTGAGEPLQIKSLSVSTEFFPALGVQPALGRAFLPEEGRPGGPHVLMLGEGFWQGHFGADPKVLGRALTFDGELFIVVGILPRGFELPIPGARDVQVWFPVHLPRVSDNPSNEVLCVGLLRPGVTTAQAEAALTPPLADLSRQYPKMIGSNEQAHLVRLRDFVSHRAGSAPLLLLGAVVFLLLIVCANVANLLLARAAVRKREMAIRGAIGAGRGRIIRQLLTESLLLALLGGSIGVMVCYLCFDFIARLVPAGLLRVGAVRIDFPVLVTSLLVSVLAGTVFGLVPALAASRQDLNISLKEMARQSSSVGAWWLRSALVVAELALALVLLMGAALLIESFARLLRVQPGFDSSHLLTFQVALPSKKYDSPDRRSQVFAQATQEFAALPGAKQVGLANVVPLKGGPDLLFNIVGGTRSIPPETALDAEYRIISPGYFSALQIALLHGRSFNDTDNRASRAVAIVNRSMADAFWPDIDPIGRQIRIGRPMGPAWTEPAPREIIGVVEDIREGSLAEGPEATMYIPYAQAPQSDTAFFLVRTAGDPAAFVPSIRSALKRVDAALPLFNVTTMEDVVAGSLGDWRFRTTLLALFGGIALFIATIGVYGVVAYSVTQRTHEMGIRSALGAKPGSLLRLVIVRGVRLAGTGVLLGMLGALALTRLMRGLLYETKATDPWTFTGVAVLLMLVAVAACYSPARRASRVDPVVALRYE